MTLGHKHSDKQQPVVYRNGPLKSDHLLTAKNIIPDHIKRLPL
jgi:hypothetical protein